ncbi:MULTISPECIES: lipoprotein insertase outer membrane protein LolB [Oceanospirillaceae]|jgi:outer membrane lipoprotein LolB|uniref:lipoprotein insertase outer membrane protein LolB n=1 Tax=Oceanospirillaceae TaxID=135620 RepID=UPI000C4133C5|nr:MULTISPECIES: lipoprotein insertase outer membrane protein LolB [Thalassolituus]MBU2037810.1 lipoprotein insertase outer membrane protein LolB [Gammaproteobacteria bacterium]PIQ39467.1 MAG: outer membrane lipoprotein LolB [Thalassolituus sp. CG17_big_fil_post_rev_8_21_14_2_50_53_8]MCA6060472.1 outer membrane lipoprotein LolB [Thalassolituus sp. ST750PaO-4]MCB2386968.1 lipoprotein insertase outer membrane protein LolB [Thalassolituus alkanivorans]MCB2423474.1 lipoprotein insertase outer memb
MTIRTTLTTLLLLTLLSGCSSLLPKPEGGKQNLQSSLNHLQQWQVRGKLSVTSPDDSVTGYLTWEQDKQSYDLFISGPFGSGASRLQGNARQAELTLPGWDKPQRARTPEQLMLAHMGWNFPVTDIRYWVKGQASPNAAATGKYDEHGLLTHLQQHGWDIRFSRYQQHGDYWLPGLIKISGHDFRFVFSIKEWTVNG